MPTTKTQAKKATTRKPTLGELTQAQSGEVSVVGGVFDFVEPGTYKNYRRMRTVPTVALARAVFHAPIKAAKWSWQKADDASDDMLDLVKDNLDTMRPWIMHNALYGMDYGHTDFEKVFEVVGGRLVLKKLKPLRVEKTKVLVEPSGSFAGVKQEKIVLAPENVLHWTYDMEAGDFNGRSWFENARTIWSAWEKTSKQLGRYTQKVAGTTVLLRYPQGDLKGESGDVQANKKHAENILAGLGRGAGVAIPVRFFGWAQDMLRKGIDPTKLVQWQFDLLEPKAAHGKDFVDTLQHQERQLARALLVPERAILEGVHGTKADAGEHGDVFLTIAQEVLEDIIRHLNWYVVDQLLVLNWGEAARGQVWIEPEPLQDEAKSFLRALFRQVINPQTADLLENWLDLDAVLELLGLPKAQGRVSVGQVESSAELTPEEDRDQVVAAALTRMVGDLARRRGNGNGTP